MVVAIRGDKIRLGIQAPRDVHIVRSEIDDGRDVLLLRSPTDYEGRRVRVRPDLLKREPFLQEDLTDVPKRDGLDATIVNAEFASRQLFFHLDIDTIPQLPRFEEKDGQLIESSQP